MTQQNIINKLKPDSHTKVLLYIFLIGLAFRLWGITNPLLDFHSWRQTLTASVAQNFFTDGMNLFSPSTNFINENFEFEFHLYTYIVALLYKVFGVHDWLGRLVAVAFLMGTMWVLYLLGKRYFDERVAAVAVAFFAVLPMSVYYTRTFMPESAMLFFSVALLYCFTRWLDTEQWHFFILACLSGALVFLVKLPTLYLGAPLLFLVLNKYGKSFLVQWKLYLFALAILLPPLMWYSHMVDIRIQVYGGENIWLSNDKLANLETLKDYKFYKLIFATRLIEKMFAFTAFPFLVLGMIAKVKKKEDTLFHIWFASVCIFFLIVAHGNRVHEYYQIPIIPAGCFFIGQFLVKFFESRKDPRLWRSDYKACIVLIMIVFLPIHSIYKLDKRMNYNDGYLLIGKEIVKHAKPGERIIVQDKYMKVAQPTMKSNQSITKSNQATQKLAIKGNGAPQILYFANRKGWTYGVNINLSPKNIEEHIAEGATVYAMAKFSLEKENKKLFDYLSSEHQLVEQTPLVTVFKLKGD